MDNNMSAATFIYRSSASGGSSSAASCSTGTGSSSTGGGSVGPGNVSLAGGGGGGNGAVGAVAASRMAVIGVTRNIRLRRRGTSGFGFSLRGGREYAAGFYVSDVQPGGEAYKNGLRVGDQIIRVNGYPVEDAVHQEVALLAKNQQVLILKVKSVGMIPVKDNPNDPLTWRMVQEQQQMQQQQLEIQYNDLNEAIPYNKVRIRVILTGGQEKGRLGCGVCKGIVPGLTVQGTREGGPARLAGLKAGDVIIWCNGQQLDNIPFERAIEVMRSASILDLIVNRPIPQNNSLYDCPETLWMRGSSNYDDSESLNAFTTSNATSTMTTIPPPPPPHHYYHNHDPSNFNSQLLARRYHPQDNDSCIDRNERLCSGLTTSTIATKSGYTSSESSHHHHNYQEEGINNWTKCSKPNNTTVIRVNHNNINNHLNHSNIQQTSEDNFKLHSAIEPLYDPVAKCCCSYESHDFDANPVVEERSKKLMYEEKNNDEFDNFSNVITDDVHNFKNNAAINKQQAVSSVQVYTSFDSPTQVKSVVSASLSSPPPPPPPPSSFKWQQDTKSMINMNKQMGSTMSMGSTGSTETESSLESCGGGGSGGGKDSISTSSSSSTSSYDPSLTAITSIPPKNLSLGKLTDLSRTLNRPTVTSTIRSPPPAPLPPPTITSTDLGTAIARELQRRAQQQQQQKNLNIVKTESVEEKSSRKPLKLQNLQDNKVAAAAHDKLMEEFKRAHQKMFNQQKSNISETKEQEKHTITNSSIVQQKEILSSSLSTSLPPPPPPSPPPKVVVPLLVNSLVNNNNNNNKEDMTVEMQSIESFKLKDCSLNSVNPKPPAIYFPTASTTFTPTNMSDSASAVLNQSNSIQDSPNAATTTTVIEKNIDKISSSQATSEVASLAGEKIAVKIGSYEGVTRQPSRFDFLPPVKSENNGVSNNGPIVISKLQNELVATLQRSNLRKKTSGEDNVVTSNNVSQAISPEASRTNTISIKNTAEKLATALSNKVTIKVDSDMNESR